MKRGILMLVAVLMLTTSVAFATDFKVSGQFDLTAENVTNMERDGQSTEDGLDIWQRFRTQVDIIASENVSGVVYFEIGDIRWGEGGKVGQSSGGNIGADGVNIETRRAYVNFTVPSTSIKFSAGLMGLCLPNAVAGSPVFNDDVAAAVVSSSFEGVTGTAFFARAQDEKDYAADHEGYFSHKGLDLYGAILSVNADNFNISPYVVAAKGIVAEKDMNAYWIGTAASGSIEKFSFGADAIYSYVNADALKHNVDGFFLAGKVSYDIDVVTPEVVAWWSEGFDKDLKEGFYGPFGWFGPVNFSMDGNRGRSNCDVVSATGMDTTGIALLLKDISFIENVKHELSVAFIELNIPAEKDDDFYQLGAITDYQMYENLSASLELVYLKNTNNDDKEDDDDAFKTAVSLTYSF